MRNQLYLAICIFEYFPFGGLQRDFLRVAKTCLARGHQVDVYTRSWQGAIPEGLNVSIVPARGWTNHRHCERFARKVNKMIRGRGYDAVIGFNKMPGLDWYYAGDPCFAARAQAKGGWFRTTGRYRSFCRLERAVFQPFAPTQVLMIAENEVETFQRIYSTPGHRFHMLPPGIEKERVVARNAAEAGSQLRREFGIGAEDRLVLLIGSNFKTNGVDRAIRSVAALPEELRQHTTLMVVGNGKPNPFKWLAKRLKVLENVRFAGGRDDIYRFMSAADLLVHPAYMETPGLVLIEAMAAGLPVLTTEICGYSHHVVRADAGKVVKTPYIQSTLNAFLAEMLSSGDRGQWGENGMAYVSQIAISGLPDKFVDLIEQGAS